MEINLISDTVTKPTPEMLQAMFNAKVGDDVFKQDPTVNEFERIVADLFGMEAALFFPTGTMANQTAIKLNTNPGDQIICDKWSHIHLYESGGASSNSGVNFNLLDGSRGMITAEQVKEGINDPEFYHTPMSKMVGIENTTNKGGGACYEISELQKIKQVCVDHNLKYHLDGARLWNAMIAKKQQPKQFGELFDTISVCFSNIVFCVVGYMHYFCCSKVFLWIHSTLNFRWWIDSNHRLTQVCRCVRIFLVGGVFLVILALLVGSNLLSPTR